MFESHAAEAVTSALVTHDLFAGTGGLAKAIQEALNILERAIIQEIGALMLSLFEVVTHTYHAYLRKVRNWVIANIDSGPQQYSKIELLVTPFTERSGEGEEISRLHRTQDRGDPSDADADNGVQIPGVLQHSLS